MSTYLQSLWILVVLAGMFLGPVFVTMPGGKLHRSALGQTRGARLLAGVFGLMYLTSTSFGAYNEWTSPHC